MQSLNQPGQPEWRNEANQPYSESLDKKYENEKLNPPAHQPIAYVGWIWALAVIIPLVFLAIFILTFVLHFF